MITIHIFSKFSHIDEKVKICKKKSKVIDKYMRMSLTFAGQSVALDQIEILLNSKMRYIINQASRLNIVQVFHWDVSTLVFLFFYDK